MKINLRLKLFIGFMTLNFTISCLLGFLLYRTSSDRFFNTFRAHKLSLARTISTAIDGNIHAGFTAPETMQGPDFKRYIGFISTIAKKESDVRYIYTLNLNPSDGKLYYALDGNIPPQDIMWFETPSLAFDYYFNSDGVLTVEYNYSFHTKDFTVDTDVGAVKINLVNERDRKQVIIQGQPVFTILTVDPLSAHTPLGTCSKHDVVKSGPITINGRTMKCTVTYAPKNQPSSEPGQEFVERPEIISKMMDLLRNRRDHIEGESGRSAFGNFISAYSPILDSRGRGIGMVCVDVNSREVENFKRSILVVAIGVFIATFMLSVFLTVVLSRHFTRPLDRLMGGVNAIVRGDMEARVEVTGGDEFGRLADSFNNMVNSLQVSAGEQKRLIDEIYRLNESLERRVVERTMTIQAQSEELNRQMMMARRIQLSLLPTALPDIEAVSLCYKYQPVMAVGGDFIDFYCSRQELMVFICDVSGHGVPAAFLSAMVKMSLPLCYAAGSDTSQAVEHLFRSLSGKMSGHFISAIFCHIDLASGVMVSTNAGHPAALVAHGNGVVDFVGHQGRVVCEEFPLNHVNVTTRLQKGDKVVLYTDGIIEARDKNFNMFGEHALVELVRVHGGLDVTGLCGMIYDAAVGHVGAQSPEFEDDMTVMVLEYNG